VTISEDTDGPAPSCLNASTRGRFVDEHQHAIETTSLFEQPADDGPSSLESMPVTVELPAEALRRLEAEATRRGVSIDEVIAELAARLPGEASGPRRRPAFVAVGASEHGITDRLDEILADGFERD
jgi:hypothetical protein